MMRQIMYFLLTCLLCGLNIFLCKGHPVEIDNEIGNHTAEALQRLLRVFGLEKHLSHPDRHPLPPQYMLDLYRWLADGTSGESLHLHHNGANTVRSFYSKGE
ncbi:bone morphogenetic protein 2 [Nephila pilipes]|uniref:Bone morphogenetic protein 2 n=1 Tax=Nephila pilipes TaxID=299642 RepID=A0A8X6NQE6_NEPPI|nr:bone morphogenetic protein 2 [Nephila pilipes]